MTNSEHSISLRSVAVRDSEFLAKVCESNIPLYDSIMPGAFKKQAYKYRVKGVNTGYSISIIEKDSVSVGFTGTLELNGESMYLVAIYLLSEYQRLGLGHVVLDQIENMCRAKSMKNIMLLVHKEAHWAINFYIKNGYEISAKTEKEIKEYDSNILEKLYIGNTYLMTKTLNGTC
ncbi:GNAT family N-acetyltransferase [Fusibacter sp. JL216-2]|uniref:GNAT family N-acetyltransferase n=1 Tax=Fusibacter sp. JL216-2 TaxID=3071453 RepID=UPI003D34C825